MSRSSTKEQEEITDQCRKYLQQWYRDQMPAACVYHTFFFAEETVVSVQKVADRSPLPVHDDDFRWLSVAAWFQFTGMARDRRQYQQHSAEIARQFLQEKEVKKDHIRTVRDFILSTQPDRSADDALKKVFHDGIHLIVGRKSFFKKADLLRLEEEHFRSRAYTEKEWSKRIIEWLSTVHFYTPYARNKYGKRKLEHLAQQRRKDLKAEQNTLKKLSGKNVGRGIDTLYRTGFRNHINLSRIADGKANMMISINTIVLSILLTVSGAGLSFIENFFYDSPGFALPVLILLLSSLTALVFAVFSAKPSVTTYKLKERFDPNSTETNMLYFGNFLQLDKEDFVTYMENLKVDQEQLYNDLARDLYNLGLVLNKKYRLLTISYNVFVGGLVLSVLVFLIIYVVMA